MALGLLSAAVGFASYVWFVGRSTDSSPAVVLIERGTTLRAAANRLASAGVVSSSELFVLLSRVAGTDQPIQSGEYEFARGSAWADILAKMQRGEVIPHFVTVPEGMPSILIQELLMAEPDLVGSVTVPDEGSVLPETYAFSRGEARQAVLERMQATMREVLGDLWPRRAEDTVASTPREAVILASIVEKETGRASERRLIAGVYSNRLRLGMKLDADPTVIYPVTRGRPIGRRILRSELLAVNNYNTYAMTGLPIGPICNPGRASIEAVLNPAKTDALYFVADGSGGHVFARTLAEHEGNVDRWRSVRRARGEL